MIAERPNLSRGSIHPMRKRAMEAVAAAKEFCHRQKERRRRIPRDPSTVRRHDHRHHSEARSPHRHILMTIPEIERRPFSRHAAHGMREIPKVPEGLPLHDFDQCTVGQSVLPRDRCTVLRASGDEQEQEEQQRRGKYPRRSQNVRGQGHDHVPSVTTTSQVVPFFAFGSTMLFCATIIVVVAPLTLNAMMPRSTPFGFFTVMRYVAPR